MLKRLEEWLIGRLLRLYGYEGGDIAYALEVASQKGYDAGYLRGLDDRAKGSRSEEVPSTDNERPWRAR